MIMTNVEKLKEMINKIAECHISAEDSIPSYLASIATSLAVIADKMLEEREKIDKGTGMVTGATPEEMKGEN